LEIERKFLVLYVPSDLNIVKEFEIYQNYMATGKEEVRTQAKYAVDSKDYSLTVRSGTGMVQDEVTTSITGDTYREIAKSLNKTPIAMNCKIVKLGGYTLELDTYINKGLDDLMVVGAEFDSLEDSYEFRPPAWFGEEVTATNQLDNQRLWMLLQTDSNPP
jgi:adenylate cyclase